MLKQTILLFKIGRKLAKSEALNIISQNHNPPYLLKIFFLVFGFKFNKDLIKDKNATSGQRLCLSMQQMGTTFIKLGQFLSTRPDIIGENLSKDLETLQDKLPPFSKKEAILILKNELGENVYNTIGEFRYNMRGTLGFTRTMNTYIEQAEAGNSYLNWLNNQSYRNQGIYWGYGSDGRYTSYSDIVNSPTYVARNVVVGDYNYQDWNHDGVNNILDNRPIAYTGRPMVTFGLNINGSYRKLDFNLLFQGAAKTMVSYIEQLKIPLWAGGGPLEQFMDRYHPADPTADPYDPNTEWIPGRFAYTGTVPYDNTAFNLQDGSYVRLKSAEIGYSFTDEIRMFVNGYNLLTFTKLKYVDPEHPSSTYGYLYPLNKTFSVGLNIKL